MEQKHLQVVLRAFCQQFFDKITFLNNLHIMSGTNILLQNSIKSMFREFQKNKNSDKSTQIRQQNL